MYNLVIDYMFEDEVCTRIFVDEEEQRIEIENYTDDFLHRAFGVNESPDWRDFEIFLEDRCFPRSRGNCKELLEKLELNEYDPLRICEKTAGRTFEDDMWMRFVYGGTE